MPRQIIHSYRNWCYPITGCDRIVSEGKTKLMVNSYCKDQTKIDLLNLIFDIKRRHAETQWILILGPEK